ncbi:hypothetical protein TVAGG3_0732460 [Trichomonas vaginalis G3]|uniref:hypothetical protein n=1 Tax=Trichomonas vaginalis (strain ATCC PRA-98 / G3) TaxID=412133 RepID=UPI0021E53552|nr:hypothetical protein TVAGG3_0732460 [Trichomonas vaginalis G3]KAI5511360.1 hypothetical protein TVAGG3_0732460 [Trichomonas vaginalis G3]
MNVSPRIIHQVSEAFPYMRVKTRLKNPRSTLGKSIKEILNRAGKRQISHPKQNQTYENDDSASESRRSSTRINGNLTFSK